MSLKYAILVLLKDAPGTGYDIAQAFRQTVGNFWTASHQQIYQELRKLNEAGLLDCATEHQPDRPDRKVYTLTPAGARALADWMRVPVRPPRVNDALLVKIYSATPADVPGLRAELARHDGLHRQQLDTYLAMEQVYLAAGAAGRARYRMPYLTLRRGILYEQSFLAWAKEAAAALDDLARDGH